MTLQEFIHKFEVGSGNRYIRNTLIALAAVTLVVFYNWRCFHNMNNEESMDAAQVARNIAEGRGYTTFFVRGLSIRLIKEKNEAKNNSALPVAGSDDAQLKDMHPDIANPPVYPYLLAAWMKTYQAGFKVMNGITSILPASLSGRLPTWNEDPKNPFWQRNGHFWWWPADFCIAMLNEFLFFVVVFLTFRLARRLFDNRVAWMSVVLMAGTELLWRYSVSGLSTMLLMVDVLGLAWCLVYLDQELREPKWEPRIRSVVLPVILGLLLGVGAMTRYSFIFLVIPVIMFTMSYGGTQRMLMSVIVAVTVVVVCTPWICRNISVCGMPFGTATYAILDGTAAFPEHKVERSLQPLPETDTLRLVGFKLGANMRKILHTDVPRLGGSWITPLFLVGLLVAFRNPALTRLRSFVVRSVITLVVVQAAICSQISDESPDVSSENMLVLLTPLVLIFGLSLFYVLFDQMKLHTQNMRSLVLIIFGTATWLPMIGAVMPPRGGAVAYPPYLPPVIQMASGWMTEHELVMSDVPWAVAWYGRRQTLWITVTSEDDFYAVNDYLKPIRAIYLSPQIMDARVLTQWMAAGPGGWGNFILRGVVQREMPRTFPLQHILKAWLPEHVFITDWDRWNGGANTNSPAASR